MLLDGEYDNSVNIITGSTQHETEIFVRAIFPEPMSGAGYKIALRALIQDANKVDQVMALYPANCHESQEGFTQKISVEECKEKICGSDLLGAICSNPLVLTQVCSRVSENACLDANADQDDRITVEVPGTEWIFTCPELKWLNKQSAENVYAYHFRAPLPIDITKVGSFGNKITPYVDGWDSYERCEYLSCHASDLSYMFETENQLDCNQLNEEKPGLVQCNDKNEAISGEMQKMERFLHRYWGNLARNGNPNNETGAIYSAEIKAIYDSDGNLPEWTNFGQNNQEIVHFGYNTENKDDLTSCAVSGAENCIIKKEKNFKSDVCSFWDSLELY